MTNVNKQAIMPPLGQMPEVASSSRLNITFKEFFDQNPRASARLRNGILRAIHEGEFPFQTVAAYLDGRTAGLLHTVRLRDLGRKSIAELDALIERWTDLPDKRGVAQLEFLIPPPSFDISLLEFLKKQVKVSTRLFNAVHAATHEGTCPYGSVADYLHAGKDGLARIRRLPNVGFHSATELDLLVKESLANGSIDPTSISLWQNEHGFPDLEALMESIFTALAAKELDVLLDRIKSKQTLDTIAGSFGLTREGVRQTEAKALKRIRNRYGLAVQAAAWTIRRQLLNVGFKECPLQDFAKLVSCDVITAEIFFGLIKKLQVPEASLIDCIDMHVLLPMEFLPQLEWDKAIKQALLSTDWPVELDGVLATLTSVPRFHVLDCLRHKFGANIAHASFASLPRLSTAEMCIYALRKAQRPVHISELRAMVFKFFADDLSEHHVNATVGRLKEAVIAAPGTYTLYENLSYSEAQLTHIRNRAYTCLLEKQAFLSSKVLFDRFLPASTGSLPDGFNHYLLLGIVQDDERFITKRGNMVGLASFNLDATFISLEDEVRNLVLRCGPISMPDIIERLSETRKLCNDSGIRQILAQTPDVIRIGRRTFDSLHRFFETREEYDDMLLAIKVSLLPGPKGLYALIGELSELGFPRVTSGVVESLLNAMEQVVKIAGTYRLESIEEELVIYRDIALTCLVRGQGRVELELRLRQTAVANHAEKLIGYDSRFLANQNGPNDSSDESEIGSILDEFDF